MNPDVATPMHRGLLLVMDSVYPSPGGGGAESQAGTLGRWFNRHGCPATLVVPMKPEYSSVASEVLDGLPVLRIAYPQIKLLGALVLQLRLFWIIWQQRHHVAGIYVHIGSWLAVNCCVAGRLLHLPVLVKMTGDTELKGGVLDPSAGLLTRLKRFGLSLATDYQATSSRIADAIVAVGLTAVRTHRIANAVNLERFESRLPERNARAQAMRERLCPGAQFVTLYVGRLEPVKGVDILLNGWAQALHDDEDSWLVLVGGGEEEQNLRELAESLGIASRVVFAGSIIAVEQYMHWADVAVLPSWREGLSNAMLECMAAGLPIVGSRVSGTDDFVIPGRTGWLFEAGDVAGLAAQLAQVRAAGTMQWRQMGKSARSEVVSRASLQAVTAQLLDVFGRRLADSENKRG